MTQWLVIGGGGGSHCYAAFCIVVEGWALSAAKSQNTILMHRDVYPVARSTDRPN